MSAEYTERLKDPEFCLKQTLLFLKDEWTKPVTGFVACLLEDQGKNVITTNVIDENGMILHAENRAVSFFESQYGQLSQFSKAVVTLSPCIEFSPYRIGPSCSSILLAHGVKNIHFGLTHIEKHGPIERYADIGFNASCSSDPHLVKICRDLLDFYVINKRVFTGNLENRVVIKAQSRDIIFNNL